VHRDSRPKYERTIARSPNTIEETNALAIAEDFNYTSIFGLQGFTTRDHNDTWAYTWANFIDTQVIDYYNYRFEALKGRVLAKPEGIRYHYQANVSTWDQVHVVYDDAIQVLSRNGSVLWQNSHYVTSLMKFAYRNASGYQRIAAEEINFSLSKSYVVEMTLEYDEMWGPLAGFVVGNYQIVVVDQDFAPFLCCVESWQGFH
jgi:hypothetical protein